MKKEKQNTTWTEQNNYKTVNFQILEATEKGEFLVLKGYVGGGLGLRPTGYLAFNLTDRYDMLTVQKKILEKVKADPDTWKMITRSYGMFITVYEKYLITGEEELDELRKKYEERTGKKE